MGFTNREDALPEQPPQQPPSGPELNWMKALSLASQTSMTVVAGSVGGLVGGIFLDRYMGSGGILLVVCTLLGVGGGAFGAYRILSREISWKP